MTKLKKWARRVGDYPHKGRAFNLGRTIAFITVAGGSLIFTTNLIMWCYS